MAGEREEREHPALVCLDLARPRLARGLKFDAAWKLALSEMTDPVEMRQARTHKNAMRDLLEMEQEADAMLGEARGWRAESARDRRLRDQRRHERMQVVVELPD